MAESITIKALQDASLDAKSLEEVVNGSDTKQVTTRLGGSYPSVKKAIKTMFENGGLPATPFKTKALMTASALVDGDYAQVTDDTVNNGLYVKTAGAWVKSAYDPYLENSKTKALALGGIDLRGDAETGQFPSPLSKKWNSTALYKVGRVLPVLSGRTYKVTAASDGVAAIYLMKSSSLTAESGGVAKAPISVNRMLVVPQNGTGEIYVPLDCTHIYIIDRLSEGGVTYKTPSAVSPQYDNRTTMVDYKLNAIDEGIKGINDHLNGVIYEYRDYEVYSDYSALYSDRGNLNARVTTNDYYNIGENTIRVSLLAGDSLSFNYRQVDGVVIWEVESVVDSIAYPVLATTKQDKNKVYSHTYTARKNITLDLYGVDLKTLKLNGVITTNYEDLGLIQHLVGMSSNYAEPKDHSSYAPLKLKKGEIVRIENVGAGYPAIYTEKRNVTPRYFVAIAIPPDFSEANYEWVADSDVSVILNVPKTAVVKVKRLKTVASIVSELRVLIAAAASTGGGGGDGGTAPPLPPLPVNELRDPMIMPAMEYVFATHQNFILKTQVLEEVEYIAISTNLGKTWSYLENVIGDIVSYHFFSDNTIMLCSPSAVWTLEAPYTVINKSVVYDHDGSVFVPTSHHFFNQQHSNKLMFVDGVELYVWGEYAIGNPNTRIWYTTDFGKTVKCAVKFGVTTMDGFVPSIRHVHDINQDQYTGTFYLTTGDVTTDTVSQNFLFSATYDPVADQFTWSKIGEGGAYKLGKMWFDEVYMYYITDYTVDVGLMDINGVYRIAKNHVKDITKASAIYICPPEDWGSAAPFRMLMDKNGNKVLMPDYLGRQKLWVATGGLDFRVANLEKPVLLSYVIGENYNGDVYAVPNNSGEVSQNSFLKLTGGTYNITKILRNNGVPNFMMGGTIPANIDSITGN